MRSIVFAEERPTATASDSAASMHRWTQRPHWQVTDARRLDRQTSQEVERASTQNPLHWRNPERHSQRLGSKHRDTDLDATDVFTARVERDAQPFAYADQLETKGRPSRETRSLFDDAPSTIDIAASRSQSPFDDPFGEQLLAVTHASHHDVFDPPLEPALSVPKTSVFEIVETGMYQQVNRHAFIRANERANSHAPLESSQGERLAQSSDLLGDDQDLQKYRLRQEDYERGGPMLQLEGSRGRTEEPTEQPSFDDLELGEPNLGPKNDRQPPDDHTLLEDLIESKTDPFRDDLSPPSREQEPGTPRDADASAPDDGSAPRAEVEQGHEPNLFPALDRDERAEQEMLNDLLLQDDSLRNGRPAHEQPTDDGTDEDPYPTLERPNAGADASLRRESEEDEAACAQNYNGRNCCDEEALCERARVFVREFTLDKISLDISPPFAPGEDDREISQAKRLRQLAKSDSRTWIDRHGNALVTGQLYDISNGNAIILRDNGTKAAIRLRSLSQDALCFVNSWWQLPAECRLVTGDYQLRDWTSTTFTWKASALCHKPLYFENAQLERYGHSAGPIKQPLLSGAHFFANVILLPYNMGLHPPNECRYALGYYRPGSCAPWLLPAFPLSIEGAAMQTIAVTGLIAILP